MKIQSKLIWVLLFLSLPLLVVTNIIFYSSEKRALSHNILNHLESVASIQQHRIHEITERNAERLRLVASRTQLRLSLEQFLTSADEQHQIKMNKILYIEDVDWGIVVKIDKNEAFAPLARMNALFFSILAGAVCLIIFLSFC